MGGGGGGWEAEPGLKQQLTREAQTAVRSSLVSHAVH